MRKATCFTQALSIGALLMTSQAVRAGGLDPATPFYVPKVNHGSTTQIASLISSGDKADAALVEQLVDTPQAVWFTSGSPHGVQQDVKNTVALANAKKTVPVLVAYNIPFRDCSGFSAGGAASLQDYEAWIDGFAAGIGGSQAIVILEPDGLGIIPWYDPFGPRDTWIPKEQQPNYDACRPAEANKDTASAQRFAMMNYAVDKLKANAGTHVYLDGTHSAWLSTGDATDRLLQAGVTRADGFFLNISNYRTNPYLEHYARWIAQCIWFGDPKSGSWGGGHPEFCASQYFTPPEFGVVNPNDITTWDATDRWYANNVENQFWVPYPGDAGLKHFVIDTSRNGQGPWTPTVAYPDAQDWCNPPGRGAGLRPTAATGSTLLDAYLWVKIPGESDGQCTRGLGLGGTTVDPEWSLIDPAAGDWFAGMALQLAKNAAPALLP
jgi:endoglucanase